MKFTLALLPLGIAGLVGVWGAVTNLFYPGTAFVVLFGQVSAPLFRRFMRYKYSKLLLIVTVTTLSILFSLLAAGLFQSMAGLHATLALSLFGWGALFTNWLDDLKI